MTLEQMKERKTELGLTNEMISASSGVPLGTVQKIFGGVTKAPRKLTIDAIEKVLRGDVAPPDPYAGTSPSTALLRDAAAGYGTAPKQRLYTLDDYYALPDDQRVELIDGVFFEMLAPTHIHQRILGDLHILFRECAEQHGLPCEVLLAPFDVRLDRDNYTMVQPDLLVICQDEQLTAKRLEGAPDLAIEILSPSTRMKDMVLKLHKYQNAGVREYWIIDPKNRVITVHLFADQNGKENEEYDPKKYDLFDTIPVGISGGVCSISLDRYREAIERIMGK